MLADFSKFFNLWIQQDIFNKTFVMFPTGHELCGKVMNEKYRWSVLTRSVYTQKQSCKIVLVLILQYFLYSTMDQASWGVVEIYH